MPLPITHALVPVAAAFAMAKRSVRWKLVFIAALASAAPDFDAFSFTIWRIPETAIYGHRGAMHSLFVAFMLGTLTAFFHRPLRVRPLIAALVVGAATASHGMLDMMTDYGSPVAYFWPVSSDRFFAVWRPIHSGPLEYRYLVTEGVPRLRSELEQLILPMFAIGLLVQLLRKGGSSIGAGIY